MKRVQRSIALLLALLLLGSCFAAFAIGVRALHETVFEVGLSDASGGDPNDPNGSGDPSDPNDPNGLGDPSDPNDPNGSGDPSDPNDPSGSGDPSDPSDPSGTGDPSDPNDPSGSGDPVQTTPTVVLSADQVQVTVRKTIQMTAQTDGFSAAPALTWASSDNGVAIVNDRGVVTGVRAGRATITVTARHGKEKAESSMEIFVVKTETLVKRFMKQYQVLSYRYSFVDDYYYTFDRNCWQSNFGFGKFYDFVAPYILLEYDYVRVYFTYGDKDYMVQLWKGQYGLIFYGCEQGVYSKKHTDKENTIFTFYGCLDENEWPQMSMSLYHDTQGDGNYQREFTRDTDTHWWCTGFKFGHLRQEEPANELRQMGTITFKEEEMAKLFADGLKVCGFGETQDKDNIGLDQFCRTGATVSFVWQNINDAETTMPIKIVGGTAAAMGLGAFIGLMLALLILVAAVSMGAILIIIIL